jgi:hypothetical protein
MRTRAALHPYQGPAIEFLCVAMSRFLIAAMGSGKTTIALHALIDLITAGAIEGPVLVCAPLLVVSTVWAREAAAWRDTSGLRVVQLLGTPKQRLAILDRLHEIDVLVVNYDIVDWLLREVLERDLRFALVIADEASALKSPEARRTKAMLALAERARRRWAMSGTPRGAQLLDLWGPSQFCAAGVAFPPFNAWRNAGFVPVDPYLRHWVPRAGVEALVVERMKQFTQVIGREALALRPPVTEILHNVALPPEAEELYTQLDGGTTEDMRGLVASGIEPPHEMAIVGKLQQVLSGALYEPDGSWRRIHDARLDVLEALHAGHDRPSLVYVAFRHEIERIQARLPQARELTPALVDPWNRGEVEMLIAHPQAAAHGLNLQHGSNVVIFFSLGWSAERYEQAVARVARQGQRDPVTVHILTTDGLIDTVAWAVIQRRIREQACTVDAIAVSDSHRAGEIKDHAA